MEKANNVTVKVAAVRCGDFLNGKVQKGVYQNPIPYAAVKEAVNSNITYYRDNRQQEIEFSRLFAEVARDLEDYGLAVAPEETEAPGQAGEDDADAILDCEIDLKGPAPYTVAKVGKWLEAVFTRSVFSNMRKMRLTALMFEDESPRSQNWEFGNVPDEQG